MGYQIIQLTPTWKRYWATGQLPNGLTRLAIQIGGAYSFASGQVVDMWGAQIELASTPGPYVATSSLPVLAGKELVNILPNSQNVSGLGWGVANGSATLNSSTAPDGTVTAATLTASLGSTDTFTTDNVANPSLYDQQTVTASIYLRASGSQSMNLYLVNSGENGWSPIAQLGVSLTSTWQRFSVTGTTQNGLSSLYFQIGGGGTITNGQSIQIWGAQMVVGTAAAPYTPTVSGTTNVVSGQPATIVPNGLNQVYSYDSFGNMQHNGSFSSAYTTKNQMLSFGYDSAGNVLSDGVNAMSWDAENRLIAAGGATYLYDAIGNRVSKQGIGVTDTIYFGGRPIARLAAGQWTNLIYGPTGLLAEVPGTEDALASYRVADHLGSTVGTLLPDGTLSNPLDYTPFGQVFAGSTSDPYTFTGLEHDPESGQEHTPFRQLATNQGRWMSPDPYNGSMNLGNPQSFNRYNYVGNNPLGFTDPSGLQYGDPLPPSNGDCGFCDFFDAIGNGLASLFGGGGHSFHGTTQPRPDGGNVSQITQQNGMYTMYVNAYGYSGSASYGFPSLNLISFTGSSGSGFSGVGPNPCSGANLAGLNYSAINNYRGGPMTALNHIAQNHINSVPGKSTYTGGPGGPFGAVGNMMRLNALTLTQGTLMSMSGNGAIVLTYYSPLTQGTFGPFTYTMGNVGTDQNGAKTQFNTLVVKGCTVPQTSYPGTPFPL